MVYLQAFGRSIPWVARVFPKAIISSPFEAGWKLGGVAAVTRVATPASAIVKDVECMFEDY